MAPTFCKELWYIHLFSSFDTFRVSGLTQNSRGFISSKQCHLRYIHCAVFWWFGQSRCRWTDDTFSLVPSFPFSSCFFFGMIWWFYLGSAAAGLKVVVIFLNDSSGTIGEGYISTSITLYTKRTVFVAVVTFFGGLMKLISRFLKYIYECVCV